MKNIGLDYRSGIAAAAASLPIFVIGYCILLSIESNSLPSLFTGLVATAAAGAAVLAVLQSTWTKKAYVKRLQKTTRALEEISLGKFPEQLAREKYVLCSDIKQCPEQHTVQDCLDCELYRSQTDLEKLGAIVSTLGGRVDASTNPSWQTETSAPASLIDLSAYRVQSSGKNRLYGGFVRHDLGCQKSEE